MKQDFQAKRWARNGLRIGGKIGRTARVKVLRILFKALREGIDGAAVFLHKQWVQEVPGKSGRRVGVDCISAKELCAMVASCKGYEAMARTGGAVLSDLIQLTTGAACMDVVRSGRGASTAMYPRRVQATVPQLKRLVESVWQFEQFSDDARRKVPGSRGSAAGRPHFRPQSRNGTVRQAPVVKPYVSPGEGRGSQMPATEG